MERPILIVAAMEDVELEYLITKLENARKREYKSFKFFEGKINGNEVVICTSNVGLINSGIATTIGIEKYNPRIIINEGVAGGYIETIHKGDIVIRSRFNKYYIC